ncbi:MAG: hypothetical protein Kow00105_19910 [Phycisphaeraceae bacterium]
MSVVPFRTFACGGLVCVAALGVNLDPAQAARYADVPGYYEPGQHVDVVYGSHPIAPFDNPLAALGGPGEQVLLSQGTPTEIVSLGSWSDDPDTGDNTNPPSLVVGFSVEIINGPGDDLKIVGNAPSTFTFYEPGFVEVAVESDGGGATPGGWADETFYLLRPNNYELITDPRLSANPIAATNNPDFSLSYSPPFDDPATLSGYFDVTPGGDLFDLSNAIDLNGNPVALPAIAYVRLRSVSDSPFPFGTYFSPEVDYLEVIEQQGDFDGDGFVGINDLNVVLGNWNRNLPAGDMTQGESNGDGFVGIDDLNVVLGNWNAGVPPALTSETPEPGTFSVFFTCLLALSFKPHRA